MPKAKYDFCQCHRTLITIQLHPNSNQLDPEQLEDLATKALDTRGNEEASESLEKVLRTAKSKHVEVYTTMEDVLRNVNENALPEEKSRSRATKAIRGDIPAELLDKYSNHRDSGTKFPIQIEDIKEWCIMNKTCFICFKKSCRREINGARNYRIKQKATILCLKRFMSAVLQEDMRELFSLNQTETISPPPEANQSPRQKKVLMG